MLRHIMLLALIGAIIFSAGCTALSEPPFVNMPSIASDDSGGAIAAYEVHKSGGVRELYAQKVSPEGNLQWGEKGTLVGRGFGNTYLPPIVGDGSGGAIIAWSAYPTKPDEGLPPGEQKIPYTTTVTRVDSQGNIQWQKTSVPVRKMIGDGLGGAIIASVSEGGTLHIVRADSQGNFLWGEDGVSVGTGRDLQDVQLVNDGSGGVIVLQDDVRHQVFIQRIETDGSLPWGGEPTRLNIQHDGFLSEEPRLTGDGSGGAFVVWWVGPQRSQGEKETEELFDIYVQRIDADGNAVWQQGGKPLGISKGGGSRPHHVNIVTDSSGGAIISWEDLRHSPRFSIYAQRIDINGNACWTRGGVPICSVETPQSLVYNVVSDGSGGAIFVWWYTEGRTAGKPGLLQAQRLDAQGKRMWPDEGVLISMGVKNRCTHAVIVPDGQGGVLVAWGVGKLEYKPEDSYFQRIDAEGNRLWGENGMRLN